MARRKSNIEPAVMTLRFSDTVPVATSERFYIDLSQCASAINRRFYRQGLNWAVAGMKLTTAGQGIVTVSKIPNTWVSSGSWEKAMRAWLRQQNEAMENLSEPEPARYRDFKIHMDSNHVGDGFGGNMIPKDVSGIPLLLGEWEASEIVIPNTGGAAGVTTEYKLHMVGTDTATSKCLITNYANSRNTPFSPDPIAPVGLENNMYSEMFDVGGDNDEIVDNATDKNDNLPYFRNVYPYQNANLQYHDSGIMSPTTIGGTTRLKGGNFPCGLICVDVNNTDIEPTGIGFILQVDLVPGHHRGYLAEDMKEM